jgi:hypothetical protein
MMKFPTGLVRRITTPLFNSAARASSNRQPLRPRGPLQAFSDKPLTDLKPKNPKVREAPPVVFSQSPPKKQEQSDGGS